MIVTTHYLAPTITKGSRIKASVKSGKSVTVNMDYGLGIVGNHAAAAKALIAKMIKTYPEYADMWQGEYKNLSLPDGSEMFFNHSQEGFII